MESIHVIHSFPLIIDKESKILILGSFPSVKSRERMFYYMHPQNRFWKTLNAIFNDDFINPDIQIKKELLHKHHIALYDVVIECDIVGSSDSSIKNAKYLDIYTILENNNIKRIYLNGNKAYSLFIKAYPSFKDKAVLLPSTSPANARMKDDELISIWRRRLNEKE